MQRGAYALMALLALAILLCLGAELFTLTAPILKNYNEGWNAYHAAAAMARSARALSRAAPRCSPTIIRRCPISWSARRQN